MYSRSSPFSVLLSSVYQNKHRQRRERREGHRKREGERGIVDQNSWRDERDWWTDGETDIVTGGQIDKQDRDGGTPPS